MGRPKSPTNLLQLKGAFKKDPQRAREAEPEPTAELGNPPPYFTKKQKAIWNEHKENYALSKLGNSDRFALEVLCLLTDEFRDDPEKFQAAKCGRMVALVGLFGGTPADRSKVSIGKPKKANAFSDF